MLLRRATAVFVSLVLSFSLLSQSAAAFTFSLPSELNITSEAVYLVNLDTKEVVLEKNGDKQLVPASLTKIMTAILLLEEYKDNIHGLSTTYVSGTSACFDELYLTGCSNADIQIGEKVSYKDLLYALMLRSACEAANIIAYNLAGSLEAFAQMMNDKAYELGCRNTHFTNAHGLFWEDHYTTAHDMAIITQYALTLPMFEEISCSQEYTMEATNFHGESRKIIHTNFMMSKAQGGDNYYEYVKGIKTGTLDEAGRCLVSLAMKDGYSYLLVTMGAPQKDANGNNVYYNFIDAKAIYTWAFDNLRYTDLILGTEELAEVPVSYGEGRDFVIVRPEESYSRIWDLSVPLSSLHKKITVYENVVAPVNEGDTLGTLELQYAGETLVTMDLVATSSLARSRQAELMTVAQNFVGSEHFYDAVKYTAGFFLIYTILIIIIKIAVAKQNKKQSYLMGGRTRRRK